MRLTMDENEGDRHVLTTARVLLVAAVLFPLLSLSASAAPVVYGITTGTITIQANQTSDDALIFNQTVTLSTDSYVTWDQFGVPQTGFGGAMTDFLLRINPMQGPFPLEAGQMYGPFDEITLESADIAPDTGAGFATLLAFPSGSAVIFDVGQIAIDAFYSASNSITGASTPGPVQADIQGVNNMNGTVTLNAGGIQVVMDSIVMGTVDGAPFGELGNDLVLTANVNFFGDSNVVPTPEPTTALLVGLGLVGLAARQRRS